jgi:hypothetical protein
MKTAVDVHELPLSVADAATCPRCVRHSASALRRYEEALKDLDAVSIFPVDFDELAPWPGLNRDGLPCRLDIVTNWHSDRDAAIRELKLIARFNLLEMVRQFRVVRKRERIGFRSVELWCAIGEGMTTETYGVLKPGINF